MGPADRASGLHTAALLVDGHNDLPWRLLTEFDGDLDRFDLEQRHADGHTDIPRLHDGAVDAQFFAAYVPAAYSGPGAARIALEGIDLIRRMADRYDAFEPARTAADVRRIAGAGRIAVLIGVEGGHAIEGSLGVLRSFYALGARYMTLTHGSTTDWADSATDEPRHGGLSPFGERVVREMNRLGMLVDISHVSTDCMRAVLRTSVAPIIASHSNARAVADHPRNVPDDVLRGVAQGGGLVMVTFHPAFLHPDGALAMKDMFQVQRELRAAHPDEEAYRAARRAWLEEHPLPRVTVEDVVDHIDHIVARVGVEHVGVGSDFDGIPRAPEDLADVAAFPKLTAGLLARGYEDAAVRSILGENLLRVMGDAESIAGRSRAPAR